MTIKDVIELIEELDSAWVMIADYETEHVLFAGELFTIDCAAIGVPLLDLPLARINRWMNGWLFAVKRGLLN